MKMAPQALSILVGVLLLEDVCHEEGAGRTQMLKTVQISGSMSFPAACVSWCRALHLKHHVCLFATILPTIKIVCVCVWGWLYDNASTHHILKCKRTLQQDVKLKCARLQSLLLTKYWIIIRLFLLPRPFDDQSLKCSCKNNKIIYVNCHSVYLGNIHLNNKNQQNCDVEYLGILNKVVIVLGLCWCEETPRP